MKNRLLLVTALAVLGAILGASVVSAASEDGLIGVGESGVSIDLPSGSDLPDVSGYETRRQSRQWRHLSGL